MKKEIVSVVLSASLALTVAGCNRQQQTEQVPSAEQFVFDEAGTSVDQPEDISDMNGFIYPTFGCETDQGSGLYYSVLNYVGIPEEEFEEIFSKDDISDEDIIYVRTNSKALMNIYATDGNRTFDEAVAAWGEEGMDISGVTEVGKIGEYTFYALITPKGTEWDSAVDQAYIDEFNSLVAFYSDFSHIHCYEPIPPQSVQPGTVISFETYDIEGNVVKSEQLFAQNTVTMINFWGTRCGACIDEMPDLVELNHSIQERNCGIVGIISNLSSLDDARFKPEADEIIAETGTDYTQLLTWDTFFTDIPLPYTPTTYFVDSEGRVIGEPVIGGHSAQEYEAYLNEALDAISD